MKFSRSIIVGALASLVATTVSANPPYGIFSATNPTVTRFPVTLVTGQVGPESTPCGKDHRPLSLVDATGKTVAAPFSVPLFNKFVLTDVEWSAPMGGFGESALVTLDISAPFPGQVDEKLVRLYANRVTSDFASGSRSFAEGPVFLSNSVLCVAASAMTLTVGGPVHPTVQAHGYLVEDAAIP